MPPPTDPDAASKASKKKKKNKKKSAAKAPNGNEGTESTLVKQTEDADHEDDEDDGPEEEAARQVKPTSETEQAHADSSAIQDATPETNLPLRNGVQSHDGAQDESSEARSEPTDIANDSDTSARWDAMAKERDALKEEVSELRRSLQDLQGKHDGDLSGLREEVEEERSAKEKAEEQYHNLLGKVNQIRSQLGERLKADAEELSQARTQIEQLQQDNKDLQDAQNDKDDTISRLQNESKAHTDELSSLRDRSNLSTNNWVKERDDMNSQLAYAREEFENAKQAMQDWEVLAMEERSTRENLAERVAELDEQLAAHREAIERISGERDTQNATVDGLQRALQEIQEARKRELRETVESSQTQLAELRKQCDAALQSASESASQLETTKGELQRALPFEKEVKEKNLLIGKLRHEAVILNDHLTKALRFLKRGKPEDNVDRQIVTNHFLHFLALDRSDPKKFQVLQLIAALLGWSEEQREQAGLARPGASNAQLRVPLSPFRRTPSTPALSSDFITSPTGGSKESLAELWSDFLEREAEEGGHSRRGSASASASQRSASVTSPPPRGDAAGGALGIRAASVSTDANK